ncbi:MAG TPA: hypothetical protein VK591_16940 [Xanthobacteraceae bacterium]|nr:hypothetical protein [Xanthobacteraceae bacterium]
MPNFRPLEGRRDIAATIARTGTALLLASLAIAGCSNTPKPAADATVMPTDYRNQIATYLGLVVTDRADFRNSMIGAPVLKPVGSGEHYIVCVMLNGHNQHKEKVVIYLGTMVNQFVDATPGQCADTAYQPFKELAALLPPT